MPQPYRSHTGHLIFCSRVKLYLIRILYVDPALAPLRVVAVEIGDAVLIGIPDHSLDEPVPRSEEGYEITLDVPLRPMLGPTDAFHCSRTVN